MNHVISQALAGRRTLYSPDSEHVPVAKPEPASDSVISERVIATNP